MATVAQSLPFYNESGSIFSSQVAPAAASSATLMMNENGTVSFGSGQSLLFADGPNFGATWPEPYAPNCFFNSSFQSSSVPLSESALYAADDHAADLLLMGCDSEFLNQINSVAAVMHPNLVSTLKNMVAPGPGSPRASSQFSYHSFFDQQPNLGDRLSNSLFAHCGDQKAALIVDAPKLVDTQPICSQPLKVEKSETEDSIEAAVVSVDLIQNRRPFRCQHEGCNKTFKNPQTMKMHHKTHYTDGSAASKAGLLSLPTLSNSLKAGHNKKIPSRCPKCKKTFVGLYELRRHYGRKHSEGEKPFGCRKCSKKFYIEVDVRDHEKLCGEPIECKCGLKFAFKCNLVAHKKAHPACQDQATGSPSSSTSASSSNNQSLSSSSDSDQSRGSSSPPSSTSAASRGTRRQREESLGPVSTHPLHFHAPLPDFKDIPEAPQFKCARYNFSGPSLHLTTPESTSATWQYPAVPTFAHLPTSPLYPSPQQSQHFAFKMQQQHQCGGFGGEMGLGFNGMVRLH